MPQTHSVYSAYNMLKVFFDHQIFTEQTYGGISRYFTFIIEGIAERKDVTKKLGVLCSNNYYIKNEKQLLRNFFFKWFFKKQKRILKWNKSYSKYILKQNDFDVFHPTFFNPYFLKYLKKPLVITVHDMTYEALPAYFSAHDPLTYQKRLLVERADKIIAISKTTKNDLIKFLNVPENKIEIIYHGIDFTAPAYEDVFGLPENYILFVGARYSYKNFYFLVDSFVQLSKKYPDLHLVLAGGGSLTYGDSEYLIRNGVADKTIQISATDAQLNTLYKKAKCFVFPSLYEGFGLTILEAFKNDCPVLLSNCGCFEEIAGNGAEYFDYKSINSLTDQIERIITNPSLRNNMISAGKTKLQEYSIEKCVNQTIELYKKLIS